MGIKPTEHEANMLLRHLILIILFSHQFLIYQPYYYQQITSNISQGNIFNFSYKIKMSQIGTHDTRLLKFNFNDIIKKYQFQIVL